MANNRPEPKNKALYNAVKEIANIRFKSKSGIYRSAWIVREYKALGGKYTGKRDDKQGLTRWFNEKWVDLNQHSTAGSNAQYAPCGRQTIKKSDVYPLCRPSVRITNKTPKTYKELSKKAIDSAKKTKSRVKGTKNVRF